MAAPSRRSTNVDDRDHARFGNDQSHRTAPDGQRVVRHDDTFEADRAAIQRNADRTMAASREEGAREPSVRFWHSRRAQAGPLLALLAGVFTLAVRTWPIATPQGRGTVGLGWEIGAILAGLMYVAGFMLADRHWKRARLVLICGAVLHLFVSVLAASLVDAQEVAPAWEAMLFDGVPAVVAFVAAALIRPVPGER
jgi:hypothetical protein